MLQSLCAHPITAVYSVIHKLAINFKLPYSLHLNWSLAFMYRFIKKCRALLGKGR